MKVFLDTVTRGATTPAHVALPLTGFTSLRGHYNGHVILIFSDLQRKTFSAGANSTINIIKMIRYTPINVSVSQYLDQSACNTE